MTYARAALVAFAALQVTAGASHAQDAPDSNVTEAKALFKEGRQLSTDGRPAEACASFEASMALLPRLGVQLNVADCYEKLGKTASAWRLFGVAALRATRTFNWRAAWARKRRDALVGRLSRLVIALPSSAAIGELVVVRDGVRVESVMYGVDVPVDPGEHVVEAVAPGRTPWSTHVLVSGEGNVVTVEIPELARTAAPSSAGAESTAAPGRRQPTTATWIAAGVGAVGIGAGAALGLAARALWQQARPGCDASNACTDAAAELVERSRRDGNLSTVAFAIGGAALVTSAVLYLTAPRDHRRPALVPSVAPGAAGAVLSGVF